MNARYRCRRSQSRAHPTAPITDGWLGKSEMLPGKLVCQLREVSCYGSPLVTPGEPIISTGEPTQRSPLSPASRRRSGADPSRAAGRQLMVGAVLAHRGDRRAGAHPRGLDRPVDRPNDAPPPSQTAKSPTAVAQTLIIRGNSTAGPTY